MHILEKAFLEFFQTSLTVSIVILICLLLMKIFTRHIGTRLKYVLFTLILFRLLTPVTLHINLDNIFIKTNEQNISTETVSQTSNVNRSQKSTVNNARADIEKSEDNDVDKNVNKDTFKSVILISSIAWISGATAITSVIILCSLRFKYKLKKSNLTFDKKINELADELKNKLNIKRNINVYICESSDSPCITGIIKSAIYVPKLILKLDEKDIRYILLHELMHYKRKDLCFNLIAIAALSIHWFNPLVWIVVNKIRSLREYACDSGVLEFLGEEKNIGYGMTLINFSKVFINKKERPKLAMCFETNNKIEERIKMIKGFKKGSYKISAKAALGCLVAAAVVFTNGISVRALDVSNLTEESVNQVNNDTANSNNTNNNPFIIDEEEKAYGDISKIVKYAGFEFKLPDYIMNGNKPVSYQLLKTSETSNAVLIYYNGQGKKSNNFSLVMFKGDPAKSLEKVNEIKGSSSRTEENATCEYNEQEKSFGDIKGKDVTLTIRTPEQVEGKYTIPESELAINYFVWQDNDVYYAIQYGHSIKEENHDGSYGKVSEDEIGKVVQSFKNMNELKNVDYKINPDKDQELSTEIGLMSIYDKDDLKKAEGILGFNPKMPLKIKDDVVVEGSGVGLTGDSDVENKKVNYELNLFYNYGKSRITFNQSSHDSFNVFKGIKENGYVEKTNDDWAVNKKINVDKMDVDGKVVYKYIESFKNPGEDETSNDVVYMWEDNGIYSSIVFLNTDQYQDEIAKEFVNSKTID